MQQQNPTLAGLEAETVHKHPRLALGRLLLRWLTLARNRSKRLPRFEPLSSPPTSVAHKGQICQFVDVALLN